MVGSDLLGTIADNLNRDRWATLCLLSAVLDSERQSAPLPVFEDAASEYEAWAAFATPIELEAMTLAVQRHMGDVPMVARARKRIIAALWRGMSAPDRAAFIEWTGKPDE